MRIQLTIDGINPNDMDGYINVNFNTIESSAYPAQVDEIYGPTILNYMGVQEVSPFLSKCKKLLSVGGRATLGGVDCYLLSKQVSSRELTEKEYNDLLFIDPKFKAVHSLQAIKALMQSLGFKIGQIYIQEDEVRFTVEIIKT